MTTINQAYINALLADAAYRSVNPAMTAQVLSDELTSRMTAEQAAFIAANFTVKDSIETPNSINSLLDPGFDAVVWEGKAGTPYAGQVYVSMRGTQGATDIADDISLATKGIPYDQIVSMVNWWLKNTASTTNTKVPQIKVVDIPGEVIGRTFSLDVPTTGTGKLEALNTITGVNGHSLGGYLATVFTRLFGNGWNVREVNTFNSAGFSNLMTTNTNGEFSNTANMIGSSLGLDDFSAVASKQTNYYADNGWSLTTNAWGEIGFLMPGFNQYGARTALYQEKSVGPWGNHSMYKLTDLLALGVALEKLDPSMTIAKLNELVRAGSNDMKASYEGVLNGLQRLFLDSTIGSLPIGDAGNNDSSRVVFHQTLRQLQDSNQFKSLLGAVRFDFSDTSLAAKARTDFSALASLISLSPVTLNAKDAAGQAALDAALKSAWGQTYLDWEADKALSQEAFESGEGTYTKNYLEDRAALLQAIVTRNQKDETSGTLVSDLAPADRNLQFQWYGATPLPGETQLGVATLTLAQANGSIRPVQKIAFGNENSNAVIGTDGNVGDHLYGGGGDDVMTGLAGADYLEGNTGNDKLEGGAGADKLLGGAGDDVLDGGADNDDLRGGLGADTYVFSGKFGMDTVVDAGGQGSVEVVGLGLITGSGAIKETETGWVSADKKIRYSLSGTTLSIDVVDGGTQGRIFVEDWSNGVLGISLPTIVKEPPAGPLALFGDFTKARDSENRYIRDGLGNFTSSGIAIGASDVFFGGVSGDYLSGLAGDDLIYGHAGDDVVLGGDGDDILHGGLGADTIRGGEGNDLIYGSSMGPAQVQDSSAAGWDGYYIPTSYSYFIQSNLAAAGRMFGSYGKDEVTGVQAAWSWVEYRDPSVPADHDGFYDWFVSNNVLRDRQEGDAGNVIDAGAGNDWVLAGTGDDFVEGGAGKDDIYGMDGRDVINAGDGDDRVYGDGSELAGDDDLAISTPWAQGRDYIDGGTGNDTLVGGGLSDAVFGGEGDDLVFGDARWATAGTAVWDGDDYLDGGAGEDFLVGGGGSDALFGGSGNDHLFGDAMSAENSQAAYDGFDFLDGESGDDQLVGGGRDDTLLGGQGNDTLWGDDEPGRMPGMQVGADVLSGGDGADYLIGGGGSDTLNGGDGNDDLSGDARGNDEEFAGSDQLFGEAGDDSLSGGGGDDLLDGGAENDLLVGGAGNDTLIGGAGTDVLQGGDGDDTYVFGAGESPLTPEGYAEVVNDSSGSNRIVMNSGGSLLVGVDGAGAFAMQSATGHLNLHAGTVGTMSSFEVDGAQYSLASLVGHFADRSMTLVDSSGRTQVLGGRSNDNLSTSSAGALISGGLGNDTINITSKVGATIEMGLGDGVDKITAAKRQTSTATATGQATPASSGAQNILKLGVGIQVSSLKLFGNSGSDTFTLTIGESGDGFQFIATKSSTGAPVAGAQPFDLIQFADGTSIDWGAFMSLSPLTVFVATEGNDNVNLTAGADAFSALGGDDSVQGLGGNDVIYGLAGNDTLRGGIGNDTLDEGEGDGLLDGGEGDDTLQGGAGVDTLLGGAGADYLDGGDGGGVLDGGDGNDTLQAGSGADTLIGGNGDDVLRGGDGNNLLLGNSGNDSLYGGLSSAVDTMKGGDGSDHYFFNFRPGGYNFADAFDEATASDDVYHVVTSGSTGASNFQIFNISDAGGNDKIVFDSNWITPSTMAVVHTSTGFSLRGWTNFSINLNGVLDAAENFTSGMLESVQFKDGTVWTADQFRARSQLTSAEADSILGFNSNETIDGGAGNDTLDGGGGADRILGGDGYDKVNGGLGNDTLEAGAGGGLLIGDLGDDVYVLRAGHGGVQLGSGHLGDLGDAGSDTLEVAALSSSVTLSISRGSSPADTDYLSVAFNDGSANAKIALVGYGPDAVDGVEFVRFSDGSVINVAQFVASKRVSPTSGADSITGTSLSESIDGGLGNDYISGRAGNDTLIGGGGDDTLSGSVGDNVYEPGIGNDLIEISGGNDTLRLGQGSGRDKIRFSPDGGSVAVEYGAGIASQGIRLAWSSFNQETYRYQDSGLIGGVPYLYFMGSLTLSNGLGDDVKMDINSPGDKGSLRLPLEKIRMSDGALISVYSLLASTAGDDLLVPIIGDGLPVMFGGAGNDTIVGFDTGRTMDGGVGNDLLMGGDSTDRLIGGAGNDTLRGYAGDNTYVYDRGDGDDQIVLTPEVASTQTVEFGQGISVNDVTLKRTYDNLIVSVAGGGSITLSSVGLAHSLPVALRFADGTTWTQDQIKIKLETSSSGNDTLVGYGVESYNNVNFGNDSLSGGAGDDVIIGLNGSDTLIGGSGNDSLYADQLPRGPRDPAPDGNTGVDQWASDVLDGGTGDDVLYEGTGRATFRFDMGFGHDRIVSNSSRQVSEAITIEFGVGVASSDIQVSKSASYGYVLSVPATGDSIEVVFQANDVVTFANGTVWNVAALEGRRVSAITEGSDFISGTTGADIVAGRGGDDLVYAAEGNDLLDGGIGNDRLNGDAGDDTLIGGIGNDTLYDIAGNDRYQFNLGDGHDTIMDSSGNADVLEFGAGITAANVNIKSGASSGIYEFSITGTGDKLTTSGLDTVIFSDGARWDRFDFDVLAQTVFGTTGNDTMVGTASVDRLTSLAGNDSLSGLAGDDWLDGGTGADTMVGGTGNDVFFVDDIGDVVIESAGQGLSDMVSASISYVLPENLEDLELTGTRPINATGNSTANFLIGNGADNVLDGGSGNDTLSGGAGNDTYLVDSTNDVITEAASGGVDSVASAASYSLSDNIENLSLTGTSSINATGNRLNNTLTGNVGNNRLDGGEGADTLSGGAGNDTYVVDNVGDFIIEAAAGGSDLVEASLTWTLAAELESLTLTGSAGIDGTGNSLANRVTGNAGANRLDGGAGADTLVGGAGDDVYVVDSAADVVTELAAGGIDTVQSTVTFSLGANVENLTLTGNGAINATGNAGANVLTGNSASNVISGGAGNDSMQGGAGDDSYVVEDLGDVIIEKANEGNDQVQASITFTLSSHVERLTLVGTNAINGTGNDLANVLVGNSAANKLTGGAGDDSLDGGVGVDTLVGGTGNDSYIVDVAGDVITELANEGVDSVSSGVSYTLSTNVENLTLTGTSSLTGTGNAAANLLVGNSGNNTLTGGAGNDSLDGGLGNDTMLGGVGDDVYTVNVAADVVTELANEGVDTIMSAVTLTLVANVENLSLTGTSALNGTGNTAANVLTGNAGANSLSGLAGNDTLDGGAGNDTLTGGLGADTYLFGRGYGADLLIDSDATAGVVDVVAFGAGILSADVQFTQSGNALVATIRGSSDKLTIQDWYLGTQNRVEQFRFADGNTLTGQQAQALVGAMAAFNSGESFSPMMANEDSVRHTGLAVSGWM